MLQRHIMLKQLQEMRQQQQLQELGGMRQQNYINQLSYLNKQTSGGLHPSLVNGMSVHEASQKFMVGNTQLTQHGTSPIIEGFPDGLVFSQAQSLAVSVGMLPQQSEVSLYGTPIASSGNNLNQYSHLQGVSHDSANMFARGNNNQMEIPVMQPSAVSSSFMSEQFNASPDKVCMLDGTFSPENVFHEKNLFGQVLMPTLNDGVLPLNFQHSLQKSATIKESGMKQEQIGPVISPWRIPKDGTSQGMASLDPLEEKILFNTDDGSWESALGGQGNMAAGGFGSAHEHVDFMGTFSSTQSGSWSALMLSAVAEASSSDTGQQEEWSGLTFQNLELSADNQRTSYMGNGKQQSSCADNNLQCVSSSTSKSDILFQNSNPNYSFPGFQQSSYMIAKHSEGMHSDSSHESIQHSPQNARKWFYSNSQQKQPVEECQLVQTPSPLQSVWRDQQFEHSENDRRQPNVSPCTNSSQPSHNIAGQEPMENIWLYQRRSQPIVVGRQKASVQAAHSLGNQDQGHAGQVKFIGNVSNIAMNMEKANMQGNSRPSEEMPPRNTIDSIAALFDTSADLCGQSTIGHTSENMLDMLNKTGESEEHRTGTQSGSRDSVPVSQVSQIGISDYQPYYKNSSASQGSGSGLGHQPQEVNYSTMFNSGPLHMGNHLQNQHQHVAPIASQSPNAAFPAIASKFQASVARSRDASNLFQTSIHGQVFPTLDTTQVTHPSLMSGVPQHIGRSVGPPNMSPDIPSPPHVLQSEMPKASSSSLPSPDSNERHGQNSFRIGNNLKEINVFARTIQGFDLKENLAALLNPPEASTSTSHNRAVHGQESVGRHLSEVNSINSGSLMITSHDQALDRAQERENNTPKISQRDLEAFGHSFRPSHGCEQDFSLLHQVHYLKNLGASYSNKMLMKSKEVDSGLIFRHANANARQLSLYGRKLGVENLVREQNTKSQLNSLSSGYNTLLSCSSEAGGNQLDKDSAKSFIEDNQGILGSSQSGTHNQSKEQSHINVQMAPSWFKHYGTWKNGQMLPMYDARGVKDDGRQFSTGKSFDHFGQVYNANASQQSTAPPTLATIQVSPKQLAPPFMLPSDNSEQNLAVLRPNKRKIVRFDLLPWHKEVTQGFQQFQKASSVAGLEWASASNRLSEKVEDEAEIYNDTLPMSRAKRRLVLTTELMQQVFRPVPAVLLSADAFSNSESMIYFVCRLALGDACSLTGDSQISVIKSDMSSEKLNSDKVGEEDILRTVGNFIARTKRVESYLLRLDKTASILDIKVECQELEKFSVINRFAKFHSRGLTVSVDSSTSSGAAPTLQKTFAQRYVVAHPMPKVVPEGTNCLSL